ncbi:amidase enhancer [Clostridium cylindrosporum DSM 605]|uniref:Amidase enhancer n=2 Tax=Clostridium cylindrosporum TaxID=1495 RepID=A0A0J8DEK6_CLOCY|nr:amidase enhancer [Clostridium cylindrosporum DSM 605]
MYIFHIMGLIYRERGEKDKMGRRLLGVVVSCIIMLSLTLKVSEAKTISNPDLIKVGLKSLQASSLSVALEGHYKINGVLTENKNITFSVNGNKVQYNGALYDEVYLEPAVSSSKITTVASGKTNRYGGIIQLKVSGGKILPVNYIDMQSYLKGVLPYEISNSYPIEAIKSQAITSRTFALSNLNKHKSEGINLCDTTNCQVYKGENSSYKNIEKAVEETKNMVLTYNGSLASVTFGASNGGYTESSLNIWGSNYSYLPVIEDKYDKNPWPESKVHTTASIDTLLKSKGYLKSDERFLKFGEVVKNSSSRVSEMEVIYSDRSGSQSTKLLKKEEPRWTFGLRSMLFNVNYNDKNSTYTFSGSGYGHGVGMSQLGAKARAEAGHKYINILGFYFPSTIIEVVNTSEGEKPILPPLNPSPTKPESSNKPTTSKDNILSQVGKRGSLVKEIQGSLNYLGYNAGVADGIFGNNTAKAVKAFQKAEKLSQTGIVYESTKNLLDKRVNEKKKPNSKPIIVNKVIAKSGSRGQIVKEIQAMLNRLGYNVGKVDGIYGKNTVKGVSSFQRAKKLSQTGSVDQATYNLLKK